MIDKKVFKYAVNILDNNKGVMKDDAVCIDCGTCALTCNNKCNINVLEKPANCLECGQCILTCPTGALKPFKTLEKVLRAKSEKKTLICYTSPAVRVSIGEAYGINHGEALIGKMVSLLRTLGFTYVFDTTFGADLTVMEEASELIKRINNNEKLPMFSSCCPAWVKYLKTFYPKYKDNLSTCKSPIGMQSAIIKNFFLPKINKEEDEVLTVAITPCTAKKLEIANTIDYGTDVVITVSELVNWAKKENIDFNSLENSCFDNLFKEGSGAGTLFGTTGGVTTSVIRTVNYLMTGEDMAMDALKFRDVLGLPNVKEASIVIDKREINVLVVHEISKVTSVLAKLEEDNKVYHFIEVMNCLGGCIGGGGQPKSDKLEEVLVKRSEGLKKIDKYQENRYSYKNPDIIRVYKNYLGKPLGIHAKELLHNK